MQTIFHQLLKMSYHILIGNEVRNRNRMQNTYYLYKQLFSNQAILLTTMIIFCFVSLTIGSKAQSVEINNYKLQRGKTQLIPILGNLNNLNIKDQDTIKFTLQFNHSALFVDTVFTSISTYFNNNIGIEKTLDLILNKSSFVCTFVGKNLNLPSNNNLDTLFLLRVEALASNDSLTELSVTDLSVNSTSKVLQASQNGVFYIGEGIFDINNTSVGNFYPSPFSAYTEIKFNLSENTNFSATIYSIDGHLSSKYPSTENQFLYMLTSEQGQIIDYKEGEQLVLGQYKLSIEPPSFNCSSGAYIIYISIGSQVFQRSYIYVK